ncbi:uncharacterized protein LOC119404612 isoform X4 [Rhipicephalus sanguineus]|nr:uncharacterized protein LOC119404612 isoform X4 [Rhipicephalus sanguineus]
MRDEQGGQALASPRSNVKTLRELFNDKDAKSTPRVASVKRREGPAEVRIPRPSLAPKPPSNRRVDSAKETSSPVGDLPETRGASSTRRVSFEHGRVPSEVAPSQQAPPGAVSSSVLREDSLSHTVVGDHPASASCEALCEEEEDYVTPISLSKPLEPPHKKSVPSAPPRSEEACMPKPVEGSSHRTKPKLPEPPLYVPAQLVHHPVVSGWLRRELPGATACPPKPTRPSGMRLLVYSSLQNVAPSAAQLNRPLLPDRSTPPPAPPSRAPPPRPSVPKPPRMLPSLPTTSPADDACSEPRQPTSPIPEYTEDEELGSIEADAELYADTEMDNATPPSLPPARTPTVPPQPQEDELYQDTLEELYEEMPTAEIAPALPPPLKVLDNLPRKDKQQHDSVCKAFGLPSGWEQLQPVDAGHARTSCSGGGTKNLDLPLHCGEPVYVLRFENNPPGKWLVRNHRGEVGYADLMNIEVDAESVKFAAEASLDRSPDHSCHWLAKLTSCVGQVRSALPPPLLSHDAVTTNTFAGLPSKPFAEASLHTARGMGASRASIFLAFIA